MRDLILQLSKSSIYSTKPEKGWNATKSGAEKGWDKTKTGAEELKNKVTE
ncbi:hypothetical protein HJX16_18610 [Klebsiella pneumoniae]|nr:hypothetical protein HJX16_18610 [Klebsiella pneumoniae]QPK37243.1 hypothetical protein GOY40_018390 [Klebsiella pneumoniae]GKK92425.1 hypothetical protein NUBL10709_03390 [Klebsiella pneumoniae]